MVKSLRPPTPVSGDLQSIATPPEPKRARYVSLPPLLALLNAFSRMASYFEAARPRQEVRSKIKAANSDGLLHLRGAYAEPSHLRTDAVNEAPFFEP